MSRVELAGDTARVKYQAIPGDGEWKHWYCQSEREAHAFYGKLKGHAYECGTTVVAFVEIKAGDEWGLAGKQTTPGRESA